MSIGSEEASAAASAAAAAAAQLRAETDQQRYANIELPTYTNISLPNAIGGLTGFIPGGYVGGYGGLPTFGALTGAASEMGQIGSNLDPRLAALGYSAGERTLGGRQLDLAGDAQRAREYENNRDFNASRSDADRTFAENQRQAFQDQGNKDTQLALEMGVDPRTVMNGQVMPEYLQPHADWARAFAQGNQGRLPTYQDLVGTLGKMGLQPEQFNNGKPYPGTLPTAGPGVIFDPNHGGYLDVVSGQTLGTRDAAAVIGQRQAQAPQVVGTDPKTGQPIYGHVAGTDAAVQASPQGAGGGGVAGDGRVMALSGAGGMVEGGGKMLGPMVGDPSAGAAPGALNLGGSGATAALPGGAPMSQAQRNLLEQGRETDVRAQLDQNAQAIQNKQVEFAHAVATGNLDLANRAQTELTTLNNAKLALEQSGQAFQQGIEEAGVTGTYNGRDTLAKGGLMGQLNGENTLETGKAIGNIAGQQTLESGALTGTFNGHATLPGQIAYGGDALVNGGLTLQAQEDLGRVGGQATLAREGQESDTALKALQLQSQLRADPFQLEQYRRGLTSTGIPNAIAAVAGRGQLPTFGGSVGAAPGTPTLGGAVAGAVSSGVTGPHFGAPGNVIPMQRTGTGADGTPQFGMASVDRQAAALGKLSNINGRQYLKLDPSGQAYVNSAYKYAGEAGDDADVQAAARRSLPGFSGPSFGRIAA